MLASWREYTTYFLRLSSPFIPASQRSCGKVILSVVFVCHFLRRGGGSHVTITRDALDLTTQGHTWSLSATPHLPIHGPSLYKDSLGLAWALLTWDLTVQGSVPDQVPPPPSHVQTCSLCTKYSWQVGGSHLLESFVVFSLVAVSFFRRNNDRNSYCCLSSFCIVNYNCANIH